MTKDELISEILKYHTPIQGRLLKSYSLQRLEDYLNYLRLMGRKQELAELSHVGPPETKT